MRADPGRWRRNLLLAPVAVALGLGSRRFAADLPGFVADYAGDTLWAFVAFLGVGLLLPRASTWRVALLAMAFSVAIELSQLYHAPWIDAIRRTTPGALVLGSGFVWSDLACYALGVGLGVVVEGGGAVMSDRLKDFIARRVFHPLQGMTLGDWWALLRRHRFAVAPGYVPRALVQTAVAGSNSVAARIERRRFGRRIEAARVEAPLFILGHYRSGTTHLQNLLALDPQLAAPNFLQTLNPHTFLTTERLAAAVAARLLARRRYQDEMALGVGVPGEDEFALAAMTGLSPYLGWCFPGDGVDYDRYLTFRDVPEAEAERWGRALTTFLKKLTVKYGRPLVLKSPPHTARVRRLLGLFPDARFVHIRRDPYVVFRSTRHMIRSTQALNHLREGPLLDSDDRILSVYSEMYDAFFEERGLVPEGRLCEVGYEDLEREPVGVVGSIYESLGLPGFDGLRPRLEGYLGSIADYRKNRHDDLPEPLRRRIAREWGRSFDEWGYAR